MGTHTDNTDTEPPLITTRAVVDVFKNMDQSRPLFVYFRYFSLYNFNNTN